MNGLRTIVESAETLGGVDPAPVREDFDSDHEYLAAREQWERRQHWISSVRDTP